MKYLYFQKNHPPARCDPTLPTGTVLSTVPVGPTGTDTSTTRILLPQKEE
jgi:hypothetical protein